MIFGVSFLFCLIVAANLAAFLAGPKQRSDSPLPRGPPPSESIAGRHFNMLLLAIFAGQALLLAVIGIYGVMSPPRLPPGSYRRLARRVACRYLLPGASPSSLVR